MFTLENLPLDVNDEKGKIGIIENISFTVDDDKFVVTTGPNDSGKSTTAKLVIGTERSIGRHVPFDGQDITDMSITDRANLGISFAFQQPICFRGVQVIDLLHLVTRKKLTISKACQYLTEVGFCAKDYINCEVNASLSGDELRRIEVTTVIARVSKPSAFDESEAGIDLWSFQNLIQVFEHMRQNADNSILIISHQGRIPNITDEIAAIADGEVMDQGTRDEIMPQIMGVMSVVDACSKFYETAQ